MVKSKISKSKRNNQQKNKLVKKGVIKKSKKPKKNERQPVKAVVQQQNNIESEESDHGEDMLQMVDDDDLDFLKSAITNRSYHLLNKLNNFNIVGAKSKKRKVEDDSLETEYEGQISDNSNKKIKALLPIKTKGGIIPQEIVEVKDEEDDVVEENEDVDDDKDDVTDDEGIDMAHTELNFTKPVSTAQLLVTRNEALRQKKIHIGTLSSGLLENPEEKVVNLRTLLSIMDEENPEIYQTVKKLVIVSMLEVFKDILPSYEIKQFSNEGVKLKKDTLKLKKYEENLLLYYKKFLQKLEKYSFLLLKKNGYSKKKTGGQLMLSILSLQAMCDLLVTHPYFNFSQNIAQAIVPFLNCSNSTVRDIVKTSVKTVIKEDKREEITLKILRILNNYLKNHSHSIHTDMLEVTLVLNLRDVNLDQEKEQDLKQKKLMAHKSNILQMSKKERKRKKKLNEVEKELLETKAEESKQAKQKNMTEITKIVFNIYFRILKSSNNTKILGVCLEGLAKYAHCINMEFYVDIVNVLDNLLKEDWLGYREQLHCIQTVFAILSGQGEALNLDPSRFYNSLYKDLLRMNASSKKSDHMLILVKTLYDALIKRRKKVTNKRTISFVKRLSTLSLQLLHDGSLGCLGLIKNIMQFNRSVDILLDLDTSIGDGKFQAEIDDPEYANASSTALYELILLARHYHPTVNKFARNIASGVSSSGEGSLPGELGKCTPEQLLVDFNMSEMVFNPPVPVPKKVQPKLSLKKFRFMNESFEEGCKDALRRSSKRKFEFWIDTHDFTECK